MHLMQKVEQFFFPCTKIVKLVQDQHEVTMQEFRFQVDNFKTVMDKPGACKAIGEAFCANDEEKKNEPPAP